ncbi:hypothetical protein Tco_1132077 [Tanacetum coccineum]|uniref:Uncharacterized protein n=1 Tax=Tanacetum coccineum TaxID=301880 RepID=A0ABQ5JBZ5_9ASTR
MHESMIDPRFDEEVMDDDDDGWEEDDEWLMALVTPPRATMTVSSTYEVGGPSTATPMDNLEYRHGVLTRRIEAVSDIEVSNHIAMGKIHLEYYCGGAGAYPADGTTWTSCRTASAD